MIYRLTYSTKRSKYAEFIVLWADVWNGEYRKAFYDYYVTARETYKVAEYRAGLVVTIPAADAEKITAEELDTELPKSKIKIREVFKILCQSEQSTHKPS
jgi:hypothetical protein